MNRDQIAEVIFNHVFPDLFGRLPWSAVKNEDARAPILAAADAIMALDGWQTIGPEPHKVMTREEYNALTILGPHAVDHSAEPGATHLWHLPPTTG